MIALYLKKLEIQGFKSFADKTEIDFKNEVTAIVGPNGSGKSNISDAIRWVLGEQSVKNLRGSKMEDVIFSGTDSRKALGYAEVTIIFNNESRNIPIEYSEVAVTRRMFRSGESEYYLNKNSCRLKDVRELFMDSGIGKDGYSIIGQGKIDEILSNKPEDRRNIFEEAAGITKFRTKKEESERKLEKTENNIVRIKDLIHEVSKQRSSLEIESEKATKFTKLYQRLRDLEVNLFIRDIKRFREQKEEILNDKEKIVADLDIIENEKIKIEEKFNLLKSDIEVMDKEIEESRTIKFETIQTYESNKNKAKLLDEKESYLNKDIVRIEEEIEDLWNKLQALEVEKNNQYTELHNLENELNNKNQLYSQYSLELADVDNKINTEELKLEEIKKSIMEHYSLIADKKSEKNSIISRKENTEKRIILLQGEKELEQKKINDLILEKDRLSSILEKTNRDLDNGKVELNRVQDHKSSMEKKLESITQELRNEQISLNGFQTNYNLFLNMESNLEGYYKSVKSIIQETKRDSAFNKGLIGVVAELLKVDIKYARAIDISLGSSAQNILVESEQYAKKFISFLKDKKAGRATFLPLDVIKGKSIHLDNDLRKEYNVLGLGHELIEYDKRYNSIFEYLLGRTIVVSDMDSGIKLANRQGHIYKIVTLDGEVLNAGGSLTGGSYGKDAISLISRKSELEELKKEIHQISEKISILELERDYEKKKLRDISDEILEKNKILKDLELKVVATINDINANNNEVLRLTNERAKKTAEVDLLIKEKDNYIIGLNQIEIEIGKLENDIQLSNSDLSQYQSNVLNMKNIHNSSYKFATDIKIGINLIETNIKNIQNGLSNYENTKVQLNNSMMNKKEYLETIKLDMVELIQKKKIFNKSIEDFQSSEDEITRNLDILINKKENYMKTFYEEQDRLKIINKKISELEKQINNMELKISRFELQHENIINKLLEDYELTYEEAINFQKPISNIQNAQTEVKSLKEDIKLLGNVNISSIEEFKSVNERYEFITNQHEDLISAKEDLKEVIRDMEKQMKSKFVESFEEINNSFTEVFAVLFNGGKARLELEEDEDILKSGIEIKVQPPGKKLQSLSLLSGGEKSLTAVALLFAILRTKPAPFCILDEIDAALDEANIGRYTNYLRHFNDKTQFVLITHRKTTMEIADILYGVTMEEEGVSRLISLKLKDNLIEAS